MQLLFSTFMVPTNLREPYKYEEIMYSITGTTITKQSLSTIWGECGVGAEGGK
jgi:hypothetical protein